MTHSAVRERFASLSRRRRAIGSGAERLLSVLGIDAAIADAILGDMAEERERRIETDGAAAARWWYIAEIVRSVPPLAWSSVRRLGPAGRLRLATMIAGGAAAASCAAFLLSLRAGPPARLVFERSALAGGVVVNHERSQVLLPLRVLDENGRTLPTTGVRYAWMSGTPVIVTADGALSCSGSGDAIVRASLGALATDVRVLCRPVSSIMMEHDAGIVVGGPVQDVTFIARDSAGRSVTALTGMITVRDTSIAALQVANGRFRVRARAAGATRLDVVVGDERLSTGLTVYASVPTLEGLRPDQKRAAVAVRVAPGETRRWRVSRGTYGIQVLPSRDDQPTPHLAVVGANCLPASRDPQYLFCASATDFWVIAYARWDDAGSSARAGYVALRRQS